MDKKIKVLFLIHDLGQGGAEKVLINLVNNLDRNKFDISVTVLFSGGINEQFLKPDIHYRAVFNKVIPGNSKLMKLLSPEQLHRLCVKETYDIEVAYLEGPSARVISGCPDKETKLISWIHCIQFTKKELAASFRSIKEAESCYGKFDRIIAVSQMIKADMEQLIPEARKIQVLYNTVDSDLILQKAREAAPNMPEEKSIRLIATGSLKAVKGFDRLLRVIKRLVEKNYDIRLYLLGRGPLEAELKAYISNNNLETKVVMAGYQVNPYRFLSKSDIFVCSSHSEGFSTAVTEALICGIAVCTVEVSGMRELLGNHNEYGIVTQNDEESLYRGIKSLLDDKTLLKKYKKAAFERGKMFNKENTVKAVENMLLGELL